MKYNELINKVKEAVFSLQDLKLLDLKIYPYQLSNWVDKGYLIRLKNGLYVISDRKEKLKNEFIAHNLYQPSYVSLEWVLAKYGVIPEIIYNCTSVTSKTTRTFKNAFGAFIFRHIKRELFFAYQEESDDNQTYLIAEPEKALLDYLYLNSAKINNQDDVDELRFNSSSLDEFNYKKIKIYLKRFNSKKLEKIVNLIFKLK
jgi:predicted transcriptional regulator of viral defense system